MKESSTEELAALAVRAGIYTEGGELTEAYKDTPVEDEIDEEQGPLVVFDDEEDGEVLEGVEADETDPYKDLFESV